MWPRRSLVPFDAKHVETRRNTSKQCVSDSVSVSSLQMSSNVFVFVSEIGDFETAEN